MSDEHNDILLDSARRIEDILVSFDIEKILPERYRRRHSIRDVLNLDEESLNYADNGSYNLYPLMYNLSLSIEDYSNDPKELYKGDNISYTVDSKKVKFFYEKTEDKLNHPSAIYNKKNKQVNFNVAVINSMEEKSLLTMLKLISILNYVTYWNECG